jgi:hypothetical protein
VIVGGPRSTSMRGTTAGGVGVGAVTLLHHLQHRIITADPVVVVVVVAGGVRWKATPMAGTRSMGGGGEGIWAGLTLPPH